MALLRSLHKHYQCRNASRSSWHIVAEVEILPCAYPIEGGNRLLRNDSIARNLTKALSGHAWSGFTYAVCPLILITRFWLPLQARLLGESSYLMSILVSQVSLHESNRFWRVSCSRCRRSPFGALLDGGALPGAIRLLPFSFTLERIIVPIISHCSSFR